jgi:hypothetical protein
LETSASRPACVLSHQPCSFLCVRSESTFRPCRWSVAPHFYNDAYFSNIILFDDNFYITFRFPSGEAQFLIIFQTTHFSPLNLIFSLSTANNDFKVGGLSSVLWNSWNILRITHLSKTFTFYFNFSCWLFFLVRCSEFFSPCMHTPC